MINKAIVVGRVGQSPEQLKFDNGGSLVKFTIATNRSYKKDGEWQDFTTWHNIEVKFDKMQDQALKISKGDLVGIEGEIDNRSYEKDGKKQYFSSIVAQRIKVIKRSGEMASKNNEIDDDDAPF